MASNTKAQKIELASASLAFLGEKLMTSIIGFHGTGCREICQRITARIDSEFKVLNVHEEGVLKIRFDQGVRAIILRRVQKCAKLHTVRLIFVSYIRIASVLKTFMNDLVDVAPHIQTIETFHQKNWIVTSCIGSNLYSKYTPTPSLSLDEVLEILRLTLLAADTSTLLQFGYERAINDLELLNAPNCISNQKHFNAANVHVCFHYGLNGFGRKMTLYQNSEGSWMIREVENRIRFTWQNKCLNCM